MSLDCPCRQIFHVGILLLLDCPVDQMSTFLLYHWDFVTRLHFRWLTQPTADDRRDDVKPATLIPVVKNVVSLLLGWVNNAFNKYNLYYKRNTDIHHMLIAITLIIVYAILECSIRYSKRNNRYYLQYVHVMLYALL